MDVLSFEDALKESSAVTGRRHLLLGNGFSIACRPDLFRYDRLFDEADFSGLSVGYEDLFNLSGTTDFERAIQSLKTSMGVLGLYDPSHQDLLERLGHDEEALKEALATVLARQHPDNVGAIDAAEYRSARRYLARFDGNLYTVNYDLLLYWTLLQDLEPEIQSDDGFRSDPDDEDAEWVTWDGYAGHDQRVFYLHGGLHLYDAGPSLKKITWTRTGIPLVDQIREALDSATYPLVVTEGLSAEKLARIEHSPYLHRGLKSLTSCTGSLFVHGHSLAENDDHVLRRIEEGKVTAVFVSVHGDPASEQNEDLRHRADLLVERRNRHEQPKPTGRRRALRIGFYDADSAEVWSS